MYQLLGEYPCTVDPKGRLRLPTKLIEQLPEEEREDFVVNRGFEKCLNLYPKKVWDKKSAEVNNLNEFDAQSRQFKRLFLNGATLLKKDSADRLNLPNKLLSDAGITDDVILSCVHDHLEIWSEAELTKQLSVSSEEYSRLAQDVLGNKTGVGGSAAHDE
jgi:MraZ protein